MWFYEGDRVSKEPSIDQAGRICSSYAFEMKAKVKRKAPCSLSAGDFFLPTRILGSFRLTFAALP